MILTTSSSPWTGVLNSTGKDDWETPDDFFDVYNSDYHFTLDAAADRTNHKCPTWLGPGGAAEDALEVEWLDYCQGGAIWLNPPYSRGLQRKFVEKAKSNAGLVPVVCLLPARTDTKLFHDIIWKWGDVTFLKGRLKFKGASYPAPFPSMIVVF